jgi:chromosome segregation ATPase
LWKKDKEKTDQRVGDLTRIQSDLSFKIEEQNNSINSLSTIIRDLKSSLEERNIEIQQHAQSKKTLEGRIEELEGEVSLVSKDKRTFIQSQENLDMRAQELKDLLEDTQRELKNNEDRARRSEIHTQEVQAELTKERSLNIELEKAKLVIEKSLKELNSRLFELEGVQLSRDTNTARRLESRLEELSSQLEIEVKLKNEAIKESRKTDRLIREMQFQLSDKDKLKLRFEEEFEKQEAKYKKLKSQMDELELSENNLQLAKRKAEREVSEYKERAFK